jgi:hypothetical protein
MKQWVCEVMTKQDPRANPAHGAQLRLGARVQAVRGSSKYVTRTYEERKKKSRAEAGLQHTTIRCGAAVRVRR